MNQSRKTQDTTYIAVASSAASIIVTQFSLANPLSLLYFTLPVQSDTLRGALRGGHCTVLHALVSPGTRNPCTPT